MDRKRQNRILLALVLLTALPMFFAQHLPMQNFPSLVLQTDVLEKLGGGVYSNACSLHFAPCPGDLGSIFTAFASFFVGPIIAVKVLAFFALLFFSFGFVYLRRADGRLTPHLEILGPLFAGGIFYAIGDLGFLMGLGWTFIAIGYFYRRAPGFAKISALVLAVLLVIIYLFSSIAFLIAALCVVMICLRIYIREIRRYMAPMAALIPAIALLGWWIIDGGLSFSFAFHGWPENYFLSKTAAFSLLPLLDPLNPVWLGWVCNIANVFIMIALLSLFVYLVKSEAILPMSPLNLAAKILLLAGLIAPTAAAGFYHVDWKFLFAAMLLAIADARPPRALRKEVRTFFVMILAGIVIFNSAQAIGAGERIDQLTARMEKHLPDNARLLKLDAGDFTWSKSREWYAPFLDPFIAPWKVRALKNLADYHCMKSGIPYTDSFTMGLVRQKKAWNSIVVDISQLNDSKVADNYTHALLTGNSKYVSLMADQLSEKFRGRAYEGHMFIMTRPPKPNPMDINDLYYIFMPAPAWAKVYGSKE